MLKPLQAKYKIYTKDGNCPASTFLGRSDITNKKLSSNIDKKMLVTLTNDSEK